MKKVLRWTGGIILIVSLLIQVVFWGCRFANSMQDTRLFNINTQSGDYYQAWSKSWFYRESLYTYGSYTLGLTAILGCTLLLTGLEDKK